MYVVKNKDADQLRGDHAADLRICKKSRFSPGSGHMTCYNRSLLI